MNRKRELLLTTALSFLLAFSITPRLFGNDAGTLMTKGWELAKTKQYNEALDYFKKALQLDPESGWANRAVGWVLKEQKQSKESLLYYEKAIARMPEEPLFRIEQAVAYSDSKDYNRAITSIDTALALYKKHADTPVPDWVYPRIGYLCRDKMKNPRQSILYLKDGLASYPDIPGLYLEMGLAQSDLKQKEQALENFERAHGLYKERKDPPPGWLPLTIGAFHLFHLDQKSPEKAIPYLQEIVDGDFSPENKDSARDWLAYSYYLLKQWDSYVTYAKNYVKEGKNSTAVNAHLERLSHYYFDQGDLTQALQFGKARGGDYWIAKLLSPRTIVLKGSFHLKQIMARYYPATRPGIVTMPLPADTPYQTFVSLKSSPQYSKIEKDGRYTIAYFDFSTGFPESIALEITVKNQVVKTRPGTMQSFRPDEGETGFYANYKDSYFDSDNPAIVSGVKEITKNAANDLDRALALHKWTSSTIKHILTIPQFQKKMPDGSIVFDTSKIPQYTKISQIYQRKIGHCHHITNLFMGLCRVEHIPVRKIWGRAISGDVKKTSGICQEHYVAEMYDPGRDSWFYVEPQDAKCFGVNQFWHIIFSSDELSKKYTNMIDIVNIRWMEFYNLGNTGCMSYAVSYQ